MTDDKKNRNDLEQDKPGLLAELGIVGMVSVLLGCDEEASVEEEPAVRSSGAYHAIEDEEYYFQGLDADGVETNPFFAQADANANAASNMNGSGAAAQNSQSLNSFSIDGDVAPLSGPQARFISLRPVANRIALTTTPMGVSQTMSDGQMISVWGFQSLAVRGFNNDRVVPAPCLEVNQGDTIQLELSSMMPHTIHLHGLDVNQANDGVPTTSGYVATPMPMPSPIPPPEGAAALSSPFTYVFNANHAGTYMYHCHLDTSLHMEMGMSGTIIVRPSDGNPNSLWQGGPRFDREFVWHLHTFDSSWHGSNQSGSNTARYRANYFMINGRDGAALMSDPVSALHASAGETVLIRAVNTGYLPANIDLAGVKYRVVSSDGRRLMQEIEMRNFVIAPGERYDILFTMPAAINDMVKVEYFNIMGTQVLGTATTAISSF